jgi:SAM-dependent methyltransferase
MPWIKQMTALTTEEKYAQREVVEFWKQLSQEGLQKCEHEMVARYFPPQGKLLDVGCGAGRAVFALNQAGYHVTGLDLSLSMLAAGRSLSNEAAFGGANIMTLPFADDTFDGVFMFFGALQHLRGRDNRRRAIAEMARVTRPGGRLILGLDNVAPALLCYGYWLTQKLWPGAEAIPDAKPATNGTDSTLWSRETRQVHPLLWHLRGVTRTLRWRTWPGLVDVARRFSPVSKGAELGDTQVAQFAIPVTPGRIYYHLYRAEALIEEAVQAGLHLLGYHSGTELNENRVYPAAIRQRDKQLLFAFERTNSLPK